MIQKLDGDASSNLQNKDQVLYLMGLRSGSGLERAAGEGTGEASRDLRPGLEVEDCTLGSSLKACLLGLLSLLALRLQRQ